MKLLKYIWNSDKFWLMWATWFWTWTALDFYVGGDHDEIWIFGVWSILLVVNVRRNLPEGRRRGTSQKKAP